MFTDFGYEREKKKNEATHEKKLNPLLKLSSTAIATRLAGLN